MSNVVQLKKPGIRNEADLKRFVKHHENAEPGQLVQAINISIQLAMLSESARQNHRLNAGRMLLELRQQIETGGDDWWKWQAGKFTRSRKDMEKLMRMARADDPEDALEEERTEARERMARSRGANVRSNDSAIDHILHLIAALTDREREQLRETCEEKWQW